MARQLGYHGGMSPLTARWWLRRLPDLVLVTRVEATPEERAAASPPHQALALFEDWRAGRHQDDSERTLLLELASDWGEAVDWPRASPIELLVRVRDEITAGRLLLIPAVVAAPAPAPTPKGDSPTPPPPAPPVKPPPAVKPKTDTAWVEIQLVDDSGAPFVASYTIELTDGNSMKGSSSGGKIRMEGIPPGECHLTFPDLDSSEIAAG